MKNKPKGACFVNTKGFDWWLMTHLPISWYMEYTFLRIRVYGIRYKHVFAKNHRVYQKDRLLFWRKPVKTDVMWT